MRRGTVAGMMAGMAMLAGGASAAGLRHVPSPDWRDQVIYFVMIDRFDNADTRNDDQHAGEFDPADARRYSGGDLRGVTRRLDYIRGLGATAVWITPPVAHQWWNARANYGGYHGYWADDFSKIDPHFGTLADYRALADGLHARGMYLVQDVVVNHVADYFRYDVPTHDAAHGYVPVADPRGRTAPMQPPFDLNDPRRARDRAAGIYHWTPDIRDFADPVQEKTWQLAGLDDLNTENPAVRRALRASYGHWIRDVGVDAFRVDTAFYVPPAYFDDFLHADDPAAPGIMKVAASTGRNAFHVFGEGFGIDRAYGDTQARRIETYVRDASGRALMPGMINFPLYGTTLDVLARGRPTAELADRIERMMRLHSAPHLMPTFLDNHDVDRFLASGSDAALRQGLLMLMTLPGIPTIYYGTEQGFTRPRAAMFARGVESGGADHFDGQSPGYRYLRRVTALRRANRVFSRGMPRLLASTPVGPGALVYRMDADGATAIVALNTAEHPVLVDALDARLPTGAAWQPVFSIDGESPLPGLDASGRAMLVLPPRAGRVWKAEPGAAVVDPPAAPTLAAAQRNARGALGLSGTAAAGTRLQLVVDGDLSRAIAVTANTRGEWTATLATGELDEGVDHRVVAYAAAMRRASDAHVFRVQREWHPVAEVEDPAGDDRGPDGRYTYPADPGWGENHQLDLRRVQAFTSGGALKLAIGLNRLTRSWNPANGFDHVALTLYIDLPGREGLRTMPLQHAQLPVGLDWDARLRIGGWSNVLTTTDGADAAHEGRTMSPGAGLAVDEATSTLHVTIPAAALGHRPSLAGARLYVTTWDYDGGYRALAPVAGPHAFGGGTADGPRVMDAVLITLP